MIYYTLYGVVNFFPSCEMGQLPNTPVFASFECLLERGEAYVNAL